MDDGTREQTEPGRGLVSISEEEAQRIGDVLAVTLRTLQVLSGHPLIPPDLRGSLSEIAANTAQGVAYARKILGLDQTPVN